MMRLFPPPRRSARIAIALSLLAAPVAIPAVTAPSPLTIEQLYADRSIIGTAPEGALWSGDGRRLLFLWNDAGGRFRDLWTYDAISGRKQRLTRLAAAGTAPDAPGIADAAWLADGRIAFTLAGVLNVVDARGTVRAVAAAPRGAAKLTASPDGRRLVFAAGGTLWILDGAAPPRALFAAVPKMAVESVEWSRDGRRLAVLMADSRTMREVTIAYDAGGTAHRDIVPRAFPGDPGNIQYRIGVIDTGRTIAPLWLDRPDAGDPVWSYGLSPDGRSLFVEQSDLTIKHHRVDLYDLASGRRAPFFAEADPHKIRPDWQAAWAPDGRGLVLLLDRGGYNHLHHIASPGAQPRALTRGEWEVAGFRVDAAHRTLYFLSNQAGYAERRWYATGMDGGAIRPVTPTPGTHEAVFSPGFDRIADRASDDMTPPELFVGTPTGGKALARITASPLPAFARQRWATVRYVDYRSHVDGAPLTARVLLPPDHDPKRRYPLIVGSVYSDAVRNQWGGRNAHPTWGLDQYLVAHGYIVVNPGIRGSFGRGSAWNRPMHLDYGGLDIEDIQDGARHMVAAGYADPARIGIWGSSYGGLMTLMSLFKKPGFYAAGVAGAPASNVFHAYPEQEWIMGPPSGADFPARYERQSALYHSAGLRDPLMIVHGTRDEVVLYADTIALVERLIAQNKRFELVTLPGSGHGWDNEGLPQTRFAFSRMVDFLDRNLHPERPANPD
jgi:dipeptidyl-peptidase-4